MLRLISVTPVIKQRVKEMLEVLIPEVGHVKVTNSGLVHFKKRWWSLKRETSTITDLLIGLIPRRISEYSMASRKGEDVYSTLNKVIAGLIYANAYSNNIDLCDFVWDQYNKHCVIVSYLDLRTISEENLLKQTNYLPAIKSFSTSLVKELIQIISKDNKSRTLGDKFQERLINIKNNLPAVKPQVVINIQRFFTTTPIFTT